MIKEQILLSDIIVYFIYTGYYIYTEASNQPANATARIVSQNMTIGDVGTCVHFWFHMYGSSIGTLNVYGQQGTDNSIVNSLPFISCFLISTDFCLVD